MPVPETRTHAVSSPSPGAPRGAAAPRRVLALLRPVAVFSVLLAAGCEGGCGQQGGRSRDGVITDAGSAAAQAEVGVARAADRAVATFGSALLAASELREELALKRRVAAARGQGGPANTGLGDKGFRRSVLLDLVDRQIVRAAAASRDLMVDPESLEAELARDPGDGSPAWKQLLRDRLLAHQLARHLIGPLDDARLREHYARREERIDVRLVRIPRTPTSKEIDRFLSERPDEVDAYYREHRQQFRTPVRRRARYFSLAVPPQADKAERARIQADATRMRQRVVDGRAELLDLVRRFSTHSSRRRDGLVGPVTRGELPAAFSVEVGGISQVHQDLEGFYFVEALEEQAPTDRPLDGALRREVAARAVVAARANLYAWGQAETIRRGMAGEMPLGPALAGVGVHPTNTGLFARGSNDQLPSIGLVPSEFIDALFSRRGPAPPEPVTQVGAALVVAQVIDHQPPDWGRFDERKAELRREILRWEARAALTRWLSEQPARRSISINYEVLMALQP